MKKILKKTALVIGGSGGIGSEAVKSLIDAGFHVCSSYNSNKKKAEKLTSGFSSEEVSLYQMDLTSERSISSTMENILKQRSAIDVVVFSPTLELKNKSIQSISWEDYSKHLNLQVRGLFLLVRSLLKQIQSKHKTKFIVLLTEYCLGKPPTGLSDYITAKYGLMGLVKTMAVDLARFGATFNMISPGMTQTELLKNVPPKFIEMATLSNPLKRLATPKDVAGVIAFLASDASDYINGANIPVNGGSVML